MCRRAADLKRPQAHFTEFARQADGGSDGPRRHWKCRPTPFVDVDFGPSSQKPKPSGHRPGLPRHARPDGWSSSPPLKPVELLQRLAIGLVVASGWRPDHAEQGHRRLSGGRRSPNRTQNCQVQSIDFFIRNSNKNYLRPHKWQSRQNRAPPDESDPPSPLGTRKPGLSIRRSLEARCDNPLQRKLRVLHKTIATLEHQLGVQIQGLRC